MKNIFAIQFLKDLAQSAIMIQLFGFSTYVRSTDSLESYKGKIRTWKPKDCPCRICKNYIPNVGFLETFG